MPVSVDASVLTTVSHHTIVSFPVCECLFSECVEERRHVYIKGPLYARQRRGDGATSGAAAEMSPGPVSPVLPVRHSARAEDGIVRTHSRQLVELST